MSTPSRSAPPAAPGMADPAVFPLVDVPPEALGAPASVAARLGRLARVRAAMVAAGVDVLLPSLGADLPWLSGYEAMPLERPTVLVVPADDDATLVVPRLEAPRVQADERLFALRPWEETDDAAGIVAELVGRRAELAVSDRCWAALLLALQQAMPHARWRPASAVVGPLRAVKDAEEVAALAAAAAAADRVAAALQGGEIALVGRREADVSAEIARRLLAEGHERVNFAIVASGPNAASPHHEPGERVIQEHEMVVCDFGGTLRLDDSSPGYCSDITRTVITGPPDAEIAACYGALHAAQRAAVAAVAPGVACEEIDRVARDLISAAGFGPYFIHRTGHGIGLEEHEAPWIVAGNREPLAPGHAFSVEPGIYLPGRFGARIEDIVVATEGGVQPLNTAAHDLVVVEA